MRQMVLMAVVAAVALPLHAQSEQEFRVTARQVIDSVISDRVDEFANNPDDLDVRADIIDQFTPLLTDIVSRLNASREQNADRLGSRQLADQWRFRRADVQTGAGTSSGTTSAVLNPLLPASFGIGMESGSITRTISGNTISIKFNPAGLFCSSAAPGSDAALRMSGCLDTWRRVGASLSFDTDRAEAPQGAAGIKPLGNQFSEAAVRVSLLNRRDPGNAAFQARLGEWRRLAQDYVTGLNKTAIRWQSFADRAEGVVNVAAGLGPAGARAASVRNGLVDLLWEAYSTLEEDDSLELARLADAWAAAEAANQDLYYQYAHGLVMSAEYTLQRPDISTEAIGMVVPAGIRPPNLHTGRLLIAKGLPTRSLDFNFNLSASWFAETRPGMSGNLRDVRAGVEGKFLLRTIPSFGVPVLSFSGVWIRLHQPPLGLGVTIQDENIDKPGNIGVFQTKLELPTANAAVRIPFSFTYANRTELLKESDVRGQIGITVNLDALFANPSQ
jgi:hypothetical protein